jgi:fibronectin type 3 domain-containing protein
MYFKTVFIKKMNLTVLLLTVLMASFSTGYSLPLELQATSSTPGPGLHIVLQWNPEPGVTRYNIYRKSSLAASYPVTPLNSTPVEAYQNCATIQSVIPSGSADWNILVNALATSDSIPFDPCQIHTIDQSHPKFDFLKILAHARLKIAIIAGLAYDDQSVSNGTTYYYRINSVNASGSDIATLASDISVTAGVPVMPPAPTGISSRVGDSQVLLIWNDLPQAIGFNIFRSTNAAGPYTLINELPSVSRFQYDPEGIPISTDSAFYNGFLDFQRWDSATGLPTTHMVNGAAISGPGNGTTYYYRVSSLDILGNQSPQSAPSVSATPVDKTPPMVPSGITVTSDDPASSLQIKWTKVNRDVQNHVEIPPVSGYKVYRYESPGDPTTGATQVGGLIPHPANPGITEVTFTDSDPILRPPYGEKTFWYRVEAVDAANNAGSRSAAAGGNLKDITPPSPPKNVDAEGFDDYILVSWDLNSEPDMDGYMIYRSLCHLGQWIDCQRSTAKLLELPYEVCSGPFMLIGYLSQADAKGMDSSTIGRPYFEDHTVPKGSPICYAYLIKALDKAQNMSGEFPIPNLLTEEIVCQRLRDKTPPEPAFISKLMARDASILIEWIGPPVQDIKAYHVYRSESEAGPYKWVGGMTVELPPNPGIPLAAPYKPPPGSTVDCNKISLLAFEGMSTGSYSDKNVIQHKIYWYKVVGIDQSGNEAPVDKAVPISTFTFSTAQPLAPVITSITKVDIPCALQINWQPVYSPKLSNGFILFRGFSESGVFHQLGTIITGNSFIDSTVVENKDYWYKVVQIDTTGLPSPLSVPSKGKVSP